MRWFIIALISCSVVKGTAGTSKLVIFLIDGCRWDYVDDPALKGCPKLAENGVKAEYVKPVFPSNSYPNLYSILTGVYPENHGFVQNILYDEQRQEFFLMVPKPNATNSHWWEKAEPIWVTAEKSGVKTAVYWYAGCEVLIRGIRPTICLKHRYTGGGKNITDDILNKLGDVLDKFEKDEIRLAIVYDGAVDYHGHREGPESPETKKAFRDIDEILDKLQDQISKRGLANEVNIAVTSDHGMIDTPPDKVKVISLEGFSKDIKYMLYKGSSAMILPQEGKLNKLYDDLKNANIEGLHIYKKEEIPEKFHFKKNRLVLPLYILADQGYFIQEISDYTKTRSNSTTIPRGCHGYDPNVVEDMRTIFYARGPALKKGYISPPIENVDYYNLFCNILGIEPVPNNGSWDRIKDMFTNSNVIQKPNYYTVLFSIGCVMALYAFV